jgi:hypothetical protein
LAFGGVQGADALLEEIAGLSGARVSRRDALRATAVLRARNLIAGTSATLPLQLRSRSTREVDDREWLGVQPHPLLESTVMFASTFEDLLFDGVSHWRVTRRSNGYPVEAYRIDPVAVASTFISTELAERVSEDLQFPPGAPVIVDGEALSSPGEVIRFVSPNPPLLVHAAKAIRTVLLLDQIAAGYAEDPLPFGYFTDSTEEEVLEDEQISEVLSRWERARRSRRWGFVGSGLELHSLEWPTPEQLQLIESRNHAVLELARATGLDPMDLATNVEGTSHTYQNAEQRRLDLIDFVSMPYIKAVEDRLSMDDICPRDLHATFDVSGFARADMKTRFDAYKVGIEAGILEVNEVRRREGWPDLDEPEPPVPPPVSVNGDNPVAIVSPNGNGVARES